MPKGGAGGIPLPFTPGGAGGPDACMDQTKKQSNTTETTIPHDMLCHPGFFFDPAPDMLLILKTIRA
jgi:hypothetical protein